MEEAMTIHQFPLRGGVGRPSGADESAANHDEFDDRDDSPNRFGGLDPTTSLAHRVVTPPLLSGLTGVELPVCRAFHHALFSLLEDIGDFDGLIAAPLTYIGPDPRRFGLAASWLAEHEAPDVAAMVDRFENDLEAGDGVAMADPVEVYQRIAVALSDHSCELAAAVGTNPSLTFGSFGALVDTVIDNVLEVVDTCRPDQVESLTALSIAMLSRAADHVTIVGDAVIRFDEELLDLDDRPRVTNTSSETL